VLRNCLRSRDTLKEPETLYDRYSHPQKLIDLLRAYVGEERLEPMLKANNDAVPMTVQVNTLQTDTQSLQVQLAEEGVSARSHPWLEDCLVLSGTGNLEQLNAFQKGLFYVQDAAAKLSVLCAKIPENACVLDCCAAPGGKSVAAAVAMKGTGSITSCDIHEHKVELIQKSASRLGFSNITAMQQDASQFQPKWEGQMDAVIADVPCSGYGIIRKKPDIRYKDPDTMAQLPALQLQILKNQARYVKPGGILLYSTCTLVRKENEGVVEKFLKSEPDFALEALELPGAFPANTTGMLMLVPGEYETDGFFIARLRRKL
jgi:16S rRNA (cytosine967-C5)-methyltransferase